MIPPMLLRLRIQEPGEKNVRLWIPLFLLWIFLAVIAIVLSPFLVVIALTLVFFAKGRELLIFLKALMEMLASLRGVRIDVSNPKRTSKVLIDLR